ncbi:MAG: SDR family NAD(P)-dependent oxidoreductase [archaeon]
MEFEKELRLNQKLSSKFKKAIVTGGAGFIGSNIIKRLLEEGLEVISIDNYLSGKHENLTEFLDNPKFQEVNCDIVNYGDLKKHFEGVDAIFHNAASKKTICLNDPRRDLDINAKGTFNLLELSRDFGVKKFVHASTGSVYGEGVVLPQKESHSLVPTSYYGVSKLAGEKYVKAFNLLYDIDTTVLRYFHVYGPKQDFSDAGGVVSIFANRILEKKPITIFGDGTQQRSFTYVDDVVEANILVAMLSQCKGKEYNCASGLNITINQLVGSLFKELGKTTEIKYEDWMVGDIKVFDIDNSRLKSLGFEFQNSFDDGLKKTIKWMESKMNILPNQQISFDERLKEVIN